MCDAAYKTDFLFALDYILNKASMREIEVLAAAVERKKQNIEHSSVSSTLDPRQAAKKMSEAVYASIDASMAGVRNTFRNYAAGLLEKEAPELSKEQLEELLDSWIPPVGKKNGSEYTSLMRSGKVNGVPADLLYEMIVQFVSYSLGEMPAETQRELAAAIAHWPQSYWQRFPAGVRQEIKSFLDGRITSGAFQRNIRELLGLM